METIAEPQLGVDDVIRIVLPTPFSVGPVNVYLILAEKLTLVDTGPDGEENWKLFNEVLASHGYSLRDIDQIVLTHHHVDHVGMLRRILEVNPVPVYGHPNSRPWLRQEREFIQWHYDFFMSFYREMGVPEELRDRFQSFYKFMERYAEKADLTHPLQDGDTIPGMPGWSVVETKGHAQSHISLFRALDGLLISGDHIIQHISSNALIEPPPEPGGERVKPLLQYRENLRKCAALPVSAAFAGHGEAVTDVPSLVEYRLAKMDERAEKIKGLLASGASTAFDVVQRLFPDKYEKELGLTVSEVVGHLDLLSARGEIAEERKGGMVTFRPL